MKQTIYLGYLVSKRKCRSNLRITFHVSLKTLHEV